MGEAKRRKAFERLANRPLPTLDEYLDGARGEGFVDWAERMFAVAETGSPEQRLLFRLLKVQMVAAVESLRQEDQADGDRIKMIQCLPRAMAVAAMYAFTSIVKDDAPHREFATVLTEEFRFAAKESADQIASAFEAETVS